MRVRLRPRCRRSSLTPVIEASMNESSRRRARGWSLFSDNGWSLPTGKRQSLGFGEMRIRGLVASNARSTNELPISDESICRWRRASTSRSAPKIASSQRPLSNAEPAMVSISARRGAPWSVIDQVSGIDRVGTRRGPDWQDSWLLEAADDLVAGSRQRSAPAALCDGGAREVREAGVLGRGWCRYLGVMTFAVTATFGFSSKLA